MLCVTDSWDVLGCHKVAGTKVASPHLGPSMRGFESSRKVR
jgi:histidinol dehydrogenase